MAQLAFQVLSSNDLEEIFAFAENNLRAEMPDDVERTFHIWMVKWRKEALEHYLKLGSSFIARNPNKEVVGFYLAQPLLYFRGQNQTYWIEHVEARDPQVKEALVEVAVRHAREKHVQRVLFADAHALMPQLMKWSAQLITDEIAEVKTTKG